MRTLLKYWLPVFIWIGVIFAGSTDIFSAEQTSRYLVSFFALDRSADLRRYNRYDPFCAAQARSSYRVCSSGGLSLASAAQRNEHACENVDVVRGGLGSLRS